MTEGRKREKLTRDEMNRRNEYINALRRSGEFDELQNRLNAHLMLHEAWREEMKERTQEAVHRSGGMSEITLDELVARLVKPGKAAVPDQIKNDMLEKIKDSIIQTEGHL